MPELMATLNAYGESLWEERKFLAALQGVDLEKETGQTDDALERVAQRAAERLSIKREDINDITSLKGSAAHDAGFGIGEGLVYEVIT